MVFSHGQKKVVRRRVSGVKKRMSPAQRSAFRKVRAKSHNSKANRMRAISIKKRIKSGIGMKRKFA
ncbi:MAG: hypothetical protein J0649_09195 [Methylococcales bacterium]|nr:hypothetical protein [Methylococcales bacterium]